MRKYDINGYGSNDYTGRPPTLDAMLNPNEQIIWEGKPNKKAFITEKILAFAPFAILWGAFDIFIITMIIFAESADDFTVNGQPADGVPWFFIIPFFLIHMMPVWIWFGMLFTAKPKWKRTYYMATTQKIIIRTGLIGSEYNILYYPDIVNVHLKIGFFDRIFGVGDIRFSTNIMTHGRQMHYGASSNAFHDIDDPHSFYPVIQKIVMDIRTDMYYPNQMRPGENPGYNTSYDPNRR